MNVLFLCTGNSARSILCEATLNVLGEGRFTAYSAGSRPTGAVNPHALAELKRRGIPTHGIRSKSWNEFTGPGGPSLGLVITVCDSAASETCPVLFGDFARMHWGLPDPAQVEGDDACREAFRRTQDVIQKRVAALVALPVEALERGALLGELASISDRFPAVELTGPVA